MCEYCSHSFLWTHLLFFNIFYFMRERERERELFNLASLSTINVYFTVWIIIALHVYVLIMWYTGMLFVFIFISFITFTRYYTVKVLNGFDFPHYIEKNTEYFMLKYWSYISCSCVILLWKYHSMISTTKILIC